MYVCMSASLQSAFVAHRQTKRVTEHVHEEEEIAFRAIAHFQNSHNAPYLPPKILHKHCFQFLLGRL